MIPKNVLIKASEIPNESAVASGAPAVAMASNEEIIPFTVPKSPTSTPNDPQVDNITKFFDNIGNSKAVASSSSCLIAVTFASLSNSVFSDMSRYFKRPARKTAATEPLCASQAAKAPLTSPLASILRTF